MGILEDVKGELIPRMLDAVGSDNADLLSNIWSGWEKWLQGEFLLRLRGVGFEMSQETNIYQAVGQSADFVFTYPVSSSFHTNAPNTCVMELKAMTINETSAAFKTRVGADIAKLSGRMSQIPGNGIYVRLMVAIAFEAKPAGFNDAVFAGWRTAVEEASKQRDNAIGIAKEQRVPINWQMEAPVKGKFKVYFVWWLQRA